MSKDYSRCPDCDATDIMGGGLFGNKGNGRCSNCHGEGRVPDAIRGMAAPFVGCDTDEPCEVCSETGQCQTCGGTGYVYYNEDSYGDDQERKDDDSSNDSYYESYSSGGSGGGGSSSSGDSASGCLGIFAFLILIALIAGIWEHRSGRGVTYAVQPTQQPTGTENQSIVAAQDTAKVVSADTAAMAYPDTNRIKSDLIGKGTPGWHFDSLSEFLSVNITNQDITSGRLLLTTGLKLQSNGKIIHATMILTYNKGPDGWQFSNIEQNAFYVEPSGGPSAEPSVSRQYVGLNEPGYDTAGDIIFSTGCTDCQFQSLISGHMQEVPYSVTVDSVFNPLRLQPGLYEFSIINASGQKHTFKAYIKPNTRLFIRVRKERE